MFHKDIRDQLNAEANAVQIILTGIDNDIYSTVDACPNACKMWKAIERLKQGESINVQDLETNLYWEFRKFTLRDGESLESYYSRFYKMMNELVRNQCHVTNHQVNVQFLLQLQPEWQRFMKLVKQSQELKTVSYHKLYDILKQHQNEVNKIRAERLTRTANPLAPVLNNQPALSSSKPSYSKHSYSLPKSQHHTRNRGKANLLPSFCSYLMIQNPANCYLKNIGNVKGKEIGPKLMALISLLVLKKSTNLPTTTSTHQTPAELSQDKFPPRINRVTGLSQVQDLLCKQEEAGVQLNANKQIKIQRGILPDRCLDNSGPIFDDEPMHKVQNNNDNYNVFAMENEHPEQPESSNDIYLAEHGDTNITIDSLDICYDRTQDDQEDTDDLDQERDLLASLIQKLKCEIDDNKNRNKFLESSNKALVDKLKG
ncbi:hypothetical protein Tco_0956922 [Tanacetum coccineum]